MLLVHRSAPPGDAHLGKYNGLGGKLERDEDIVAGFQRELHEEAGIDATDLHLAGTISWPGFGKNGEDWFGFLFRVLAFTGIPLRTQRGRTARMGRNRPRDGACHCGMATDSFCRKSLISMLYRFHGVMPYRNGQALDWQFSTTGW